MYFWWNIKNIPELSHSSEQDKAVLIKALRKEGLNRLGKKRLFVRLIMGWALCLILGAINQRFMQRNGFLEMLLLGVISGFIMVTLIDIPVVQAGRAWLREQGRPKP